MASTIKPRAQHKGGYVVLKLIISHPMETGLRKNPDTGAVIPAHYIRELKVQHGDTLLAQLLAGPGVSKNPYIQLRIEQLPVGTDLQISWLDNRGQQDSTTVTVTG